MTEPRLIVYSSLFPSQAAPSAGIFIRERMFRVARRLPLVVVAPQAWSPFDWMVRLFRSGFRPMAAARETVEGVEVHRPRWLSLPGVGKGLDGWLMALCTERCVRRIHERFRATVIDAHFLYPDGWAATRIASRLGVPATITIRGSKDESLIGTSREPRLREAMQAAHKLFAVSTALQLNVAQKLGIAADKVKVIGNGVDLAKFAPVERAQARRRLGIPEEAKVLIGVGNLVPGKGFQRVIPLLPALRQRHPGLVYLIVGGGASQGDMRRSLESLAREHCVQDVVRFAGRQPQDELKW
ncbi:MAG: glycosyltransferase, partial [Gammaproteobacteria bacterium]